MKRGRITLRLGPVEADALLLAIQYLHVSQEGEEDIDAGTRRALVASDRVQERTVRAMREKGWFLR